MIGSKKAIFVALAVCCLSGSVIAQNISISLSNVTVKEAMDELQKKSGLSFVFSSEDVNTLQKISVKAENKSVTEVVRQILDGQDVTYEIKDNMVIVRNIKTAKPTVSEDKKTITGKVLDADGLPVIGANVVEKGTTNGTVTDVDGNFTLALPTGSTLVVSYIGFTNYEVKIGKQTNLSIVLKEDSQVLDELVVIGYGTQKKVNLTAAVETVNTDVLENRPVKSTAQMLEGVVPNLNVAINSGAPDAKAHMNIRGFTGMNSNAAPLVLVDGVEQDIELVNPNDIESISVLKDAAASAIYGSRAPFGVILITTKSGEKGAKPSINYSGTYQINQPSMMPSTMNSVDFANSLNSAYFNSMDIAYFSDETIQKMQDYIDGKLTVNNEQMSNGKWSGQKFSWANTDFFDYAFKNASQNTSHDVNISGGTKNTSYYAGLGYQYRQGIYNTDLDKFNRYNTILKIKTDVTDWLTFHFNARYSRQDTDRPNYSGASNSSESDENFWNKLSYFPNIPIKNPDGEYSILSAMPVLDGQAGSITNRLNDMWLTGGFSLKPIKGLTIKGDFSWNNQNAREERTQYQVFIKHPNGVLERSKRSAVIDEIAKNSSSKDYMTMDLTANYQKQFGKHDLNLLAGMQVEQMQFNNIVGRKTGLYSRDVPSFSTSWGESQVLKDVKNHWSTMGYFFRISYNYDGKYLLDMNARYDAASKYPPHTRWAFFPSVSAGWNIAREEFWPIEQISKLKLTASFGRLGDQSGGNYLYIPTMGTSPMGNVVLGSSRPPYVTMPDIISPDLTWAKPQTVGVGVDFAAFNNRLNAEYYWYQRTVFDELGPSNKYPEVLGVDPPRSNNAVSETRGWEASISWRDKACTLMDSPLNYSVRFILSDYIGYVVRYSGSDSGNRKYWTPGQKFGEVFGYQTSGIAKDAGTLGSNVLAGSGWYYPGDLVFVDRNGDGRIDSGVNNAWYSMGDQKSLGYNYPRYKYAINLGLDWKNFSVSLFLDGVGKEYAYVNNYFTFGHTGPAGQRTLLSYQKDLGYWSMDNQNAFFTRPYKNADKNYKDVNDRYIIDLSHLRVKNLSFSYSLPASVLQKMKLSNMSFNLSLENLGMLYYNSWVKLDPQMVRKHCSGYPIQRTYSLGVRIGI